MQETRTIHVADSFLMLLAEIQRKNSHATDHLANFAAEEYRRAEVDIGGSAKAKSQGSKLKPQTTLRSGSLKMLIATSATPSGDFAFRIACVQHAKISFFPMQNICCFQVRYAII